MAGTCEYCGATGFNGCMGPSGRYDQHNPRECRDRLKATVMRLLAELQRAHTAADRARAESQGGAP
jgi:hypothetical protein